MKKFMLQNYQKKVLAAYSVKSPSKINFIKYKKKYFENLEHIFFKKLSLDKNCFKDKNILDLGCGTGETDIFLKEYGAKNIIGVDFNNLSIKEANSYKRKLKIKNIRFICEDILKFKTKKKFDIVICKGVLPHISNKDRIKLFNNIKKFNLSKDSLIIFGFLDTAGNLIKLFQQIIINNLYEDKTDLEKFSFAKKLFKNNFNRFKKYGFRDKINVFYDYFVNKRSFGLSQISLLKYFDDFTLFSSYPYNVNQVNHLPILLHKKQILDYNYFLYQQLHWFNNSQMNFSIKNKKLFEKYENSLISNDIKKINLNSLKIQSELMKYKKSFIKNFDKNVKEFNNFNLLINKILDHKIPMKDKINNIIKSKYFKKYSGIGTVYLTLKKV